MSVYHILKDGSRVDDITGHVVKMEDAELLYRFIHSINQKSNIGKKHITFDLHTNEVRT